MEASINPAKASVLDMQLMAMMIANIGDVTIIAKPTVEVVDVVNVVQKNNGNRIGKIVRKRKEDGIAKERTSSTTLHLPLLLSLKDGAIATAK